MTTEQKPATLQTANDHSPELQTEIRQEVQKERPRKLLRAVNPDLYDLFTERLEEQRIHSYDVQLVVEENDADSNDDVVLKVLFGEWYSNIFEKPVSRTDLEVGSPEMESFLTELVAACEESLILDYRKFMQPHT